MVSSKVHTYIPFLLTLLYVSVPKLAENKIEAGTDPGNLPYCMVPVPPGSVPDPSGFFCRDQRNTLFTWRNHRLPSPPQINSSVPESVRL